MRKFAKAFTLIELLVVMAILGILSTLVMLNYGDVQANARDAQRIKDLDNVRYALISYRADYGIFPASASVCTFPTIPTCLADLVTNKYIDALPANPKVVDTAFQGYRYYDYTNYNVMGSPLNGIGAFLSTKLEKYNGSGMTGTYRSDVLDDDECVNGDNGWYCLVFK